jgi:hypothetical protein
VTCREPAPRPVRITAGNVLVLAAPMIDGTTHPPKSPECLRFCKPRNRAAACNLAEAGGLRQIHAWHSGCDCSLDDGLLSRHQGWHRYDDDDGEPGRRDPANDRSHDGAGGPETGAGRRRPVSRIAPALHAYARARQAGMAGRRAAARPSDAAPLRCGRDGCRRRVGPAGRTRHGRGRRDAGVPAGDAPLGRHRCRVDAHAGHCS